MRAPLLALIILLFIPGGANARTWHIYVDGSGDAPTIQAGIDSAAVGDSVLVFAGTYREVLTYSKDIVVTTKDGRDVTIIDASGIVATAAVLINPGTSRSCVFEGFTITGAKTALGMLDGQPIVRDLRVSMNGGSGNTSGIVGGGTTLGPWYPIVEGCEVFNNSVSNTGPGIAFLQEMAPIIRNNICRGNLAGSGDGGGIYLVTRFSGSEITGNIILTNTAGDHGGGIHVANSSTPINLEISYNLIWNNYAGGSEQTGGSGGGIWARRTNAWIHHNTIVENTGLGVGNTYGGGIAIQQAGSPLIEQNIFAFMQAGGAIRCDGGTTPIIRNNLAWDNSGGNGVGDCPTWPAALGNIEADPLFCDRATGDFTLGAGSPALTHPAGPLGAFPVPGCTPVLTQATTWGKLKAAYR